MHKERLKIGSVEIEITFKAIKNLHLSVHPPDGHVTIASPDFYDLEKVKVYAATKLAWIKKEQRKFAEQKRESARDYISQESHYFFGERYLLNVVEGNRNSVQIKGKKLILCVTDVHSYELKQKVLYRFYRKELRIKLAEMIESYSLKMDLQIPAFKIRKMKTQWGSCSTDNKRLSFNIELAKKPLECLEYIVVHEMVHLIERNHNKRFVQLMDQYMTHWRVQKKILNELAL